MSILGPVLWEAEATDLMGTALVRVTEQPRDHLGITVTLDDGRVVGLALDSADAQQLRFAVTTWLVGLAPTVGLS